MEISDNKKIVIGVVILIAIGLLSYFWISDIASSEENFSETYQYLDSKRATVSKLMGATAAASAAISLIPGDAGMPIAEELADLSGYFLLILGAIFLEKWMVTLTGLVAFKIIIPGACIILIIAQLMEGDKLKEIGIKLILFAVLIFAIIPASGILTEKIDESYQASVQQTIEDSNKNTKQIRKAVGDRNNDIAIVKVFKKLKISASEKIRKFEGILNRTTEAIAVLIVTSCAIPVAVLLFFFWLIKMLTGISINVPRFKGSNVLRKVRNSRR